MSYASDIISGSTLIANLVRDRIEGVVETATSWSPTYSASGSMTFTSVTTNVAKYVVLNDSSGDHLFWFSVHATGTIGGTPSNALFITLPSAFTYANSDIPIVGHADAGMALVLTDVVNDELDVYNYDASNYAAGSETIAASGVLLLS